MCRRLCCFSAFLGNVDPAFGGRQIWLGYVVSQHSGAMLILLAVLLAVVPLAIFLLFGWRVDVNEFSMNPFYRNRLTRCYLGASSRKRAPNPLTGFDDRDTRRMQISRLRAVPLPASHPTTATSQPIDIYTGPFPIICATINLSSERTWHGKNGR